MTEEGYKISEAARNLEIHPNVLRKWKDQLKYGSDKAFPGKGHKTAEKEELHRLREENTSIPEYSGDSIPSIPGTPY